MTVLAKLSLATCSTYLRILLWTKFCVVYNFLTECTSSSSETMQQLKSIIFIFLIFFFLTWSQKMREFKVNLLLGELISVLYNAKTARITLGGSSRSLEWRSKEVLKTFISREIALSCSFPISPWPSPKLFHLECVQVV